MYKENQYTMPSASETISNPWIGWRKPSNSESRIEAHKAEAQFNGELAVMDYQNEYNRMMLEDQRDYDSYTNQAQRMREAGLNPDFMQNFQGGMAAQTSAGVNSVGSPDFVGARANELAGIQMGLDAMQNIPRNAFDLYKSIQGIQLTQQQIDANTMDAYRYTAQSMDRAVTGGMTLPDSMFKDNNVTGANMLDASKVEADFTEDFFSRAMYGQSLKDVPRAYRKGLRANYKRAKADLINQANRNIAYGNVSGSNLGRKQSQAADEVISFQEAKDYAAQIFSNQKTKAKLDGEWMKLRKKYADRLNVTGAADAVNATNQATIAEANYRGEYYNELDATSAAGAQNAVTKYTGEYYNALDGTETGEYDMDNREFIHDTNRLKHSAIKPIVDMNEKDMKRLDDPNLPQWKRMWILGNIQDRTNTINFIQGLSPTELLQEDTQELLNTIFSNLGGILGGFIGGKAATAGTGTAAGKYRWMQDLQNSANGRWPDGTPWSFHK